MDTGLDNDLIVEPSVAVDDDDDNDGEVIRDGALHTARSSTGFSTARSGLTDEQNAAADADYEQGCIAHVNVLPMDHAASTALASLLLGIGPVSDPTDAMAEIDQSNHVSAVSTTQKVKQRIAKITSLSRGYAGLIRLLVTLDDAVLESLPAAPAYTTIAAASARGLASAVFSHPGDHNHHSLSIYLQFLSFHYYNTHQHILSTRLLTILSTHLLTPPCNAPY